MADIDPELGVHLEPPRGEHDHHVDGHVKDHEVDHEKDPNARPICFKSTLQECLCIFSVTMAVAMTSFLTGSITVMSSFAARDLGMTNAEITWMNAAVS